jgi:hypothetical protein
MKQTTAMQMQESATLKAGHGSAKRTCKLKRRKSMTWPWSRRIGEIAEHSGHQQAEGDAPPRIARLGAQEQNRNHNQRDTGKRDEEAIVIPKRAEGRAGISDVDEGEEARNDVAWIDGSIKRRTRYFVTWSRA